MVHWLCHLDKSGLAPPVCRRQENQFEESKRAKFGPISQQTDVRADCALLKQGLRS